MSCLAVFHKNKQIRVYYYDVLIPGDYDRARRLAIEFAEKNAQSGYPCEVEQFHLCDVGKLIYFS